MKLWIAQRTTPTLSSSLTIRRAAPSNAKLREKIGSVVLSASDVDTWDVFQADVPTDRDGLCALIDGAPLSPLPGTSAKYDVAADGTVKKTRG